MAADLKSRGLHKSNKQDSRIMQKIVHENGYQCCMALPKLSRVVWYSMVCAFASACYWNSLGGDLVHDDIFAIRDNPDVKPRTPLWSIFLNDFWGEKMSSNSSHKSYRPLCVLTFRLNYALHGFEPFGYHLVNLLSHLVVCATFTFFCERVVFKDTSLSAITGVLFAVHPVHTEAVAGVVGRADVLACLLYLLTVMFYIWSIERVRNNNIPRTVSWPCMFICVVLGSASMLVKEHGATVFAVCLIYDVLVNSKESILGYLSSPPPLIKALPAFKPLLRRIGLLCFVVVGLLFFRISMLHGHLPSFSDHDNPASFAPKLLTRFLSYSYLLVFNACLLLAPVILCYDWQMGSIPLVESVWDSRNLATLLFFVVMAALCVWCFWNLKIKSCDVDVVIIGMALLVIPFLPASNLFIQVGFVVAERIMYIPSLGYCILVVHGLNKLSGVATTILSKCISVGVCVLIFLLFWKSVERNLVWRTRESLFRSGIETVPQNAKAHYNYANYLKDVNNHHAAIHHYKLAVNLAPDHSSAHNNLGTLLDSDKEAIKHFSQAIKFNPFHSNAYFNLGSRLSKQGRSEEAESMFRESLRLKPTYSNAMISLGGLLSQQGKVEEAELMYNQAIDTAPEDADHYNNYGVFLETLGRHSDALVQYKKAVHLNPEQAIFLVNLARLLKKNGKISQAEKLFKKALSIKVEASTLDHYGILLFHEKRFEEAQKMWERAVTVDPTHEQASSNYVALLTQTHQLDKAVGVIQNFLKHKPNHMESLNHLSNVLSQLGRLEEALNATNAALSLSPVDAELHYMKGNIFKDMKNLEEAQKSFQKSIELNPQHGSAHMNLGAVYHIKGMLSEARMHYEMALKLNPLNQALRDNLSKLSHLEKKMAS